MIAALPMKKEAGIEEISSINRGTSALVLTQYLDPCKPPFLWTKRQLPLLTTTDAVGMLLVTLGVVFILF